MDMTISQILPFAAMLLGAGAFAGIIAGLMGVGGGIVIVPVLYHLFTHLGVDEAIRMQLAVGTSLATIVCTAYSSAFSHYKKGNVDKNFLKGFGPWIVVGVFLGAAIAAVVKGTVLTIVFASVALLVALQFILGPPQWRVADELPKGPIRAFIGLVIGSISSMMGIGGGTLTVPVMNAYGATAHRAVGTAAATGFMIGVPGAIGFMIGGWAVPGLPAFSVGFISLIGLALIAPMSVLFAPLGAKLANSMDAKNLKRVFAVFLLFTSGRMFWDLFSSMM